MAALTIPDALDRVSRYERAVVAWVGTDGYPVSAAADFSVEAAAGTLTVGPVAAELGPPDGDDVIVTFSHVRPQPGVGYDQRRYVNLWGRAERAGDLLRVDVGRASGWDESETPFFEYAERSVGTARRYLDEVGSRPRLSLGWTVFLATRLPFLTATLVPVALGGAVAARHHLFRWGWFLLALLAAVAVHLGLNMANDLYDQASGADEANATPTPFSGGSRVLQYGLVSRRAMLTGCIGLYVMAVGIGAYLAAARGWGLLGIGAVGVFLSLAYTAPPFRLVHRGLGEPVTALGFGPVMAVGTFYACAGRWSWETVLASIPVAILIALVLYVNQIPDRAGDAAAGKRTLIVRWSPSAVQTGYAASVVAAFVAVVAEAAAGVTPLWTLLALLPAPMAVKVWRGMRSHYDRPYELMPAMQTNIALHLLTGLLLVAGYLLAL
ncbi:MAG TPA: UbiA family prenyltransferase [Acidimicrobiales bacterium]|nr:UbiA family prenyltransferase [Acidimicrobiales bacterium]